jgi:protein-arginine kinase activator protein McsA
MNECEKCHSQKIRIEVTSFEQDSHNIVRVFVCLQCGHRKTELINIQ